MPVLRWQRVALSLVAARQNEWLRPGQLLQQCAGALLHRRAVDTALNTAGPIDEIYIEIQIVIQVIAVALELAASPPERVEQGLGDLAISHQRGQFGR